MHVERIHEKQKNYKCFLCPKDFYDKSYLDLHVSSVHGGLKMHQCEICQKYFSQPAHLKTHVKRHHEEKVRIHKCEKCKSSFNLKEDLHHHMMRVHYSREKETYECNQCGKILHSKATFKVHVDKHNSKTDTK